MSEPVPESVAAPVVAAPAATAPAPVALVQASPSQRWQWLGAVLAVGALIWLLGPILTPFVFSALLAWLGDPLVDRLERSGYKRTTGVLLVFALMTIGFVLAMLVLLPMISVQLQKLIDWLPQLAAWTTNTAVPWLEQRLHVDLAQYVDPMAIADLLQGHWQQAGGVAVTVLGGLSKSGLAILAFVANLLLVPVLTFYFLRDWDVMVGHIRELLPRPVEPTAVALARESDQMLGGFLRGQLSVMVALALIYGTGLWLAGLDLGLIIGLIAGLVSFVPYLGAAVGIGMAVIAALVQYGDVQHLVYVAIVFAVGQTVESFVLTPWLVGDRIGMHPVAVIFAIMAGGQLFGFLGVLLALPVAAVVMVLLRYAHLHYTRSTMYGATTPAVAASGVPPAEPAAAPETAPPGA